MIFLFVHAGIDVSDRASADVRGGVIRANVGGVWLWQSGSAELQSVSLEGGSSYVILADEGGTPSLTVRITLFTCGSLVPIRLIANPVPALPLHQNVPR